MRWGDQIDEDDVYVPPTQVIGPDANGITITIEYKKNDKGDVIKYTTKSETTTVVRKVYKVQFGLGWQVVANVHGIIIVAPLAYRLPSNGGNGLALARLHTSKRQTR